MSRAILDLHAARALSSATAMACGGSTLRDASVWAAARLPVGCHIVLLDGDPVSPPDTIPTLTVNGRFRSTLGHFARDLAFGRIAEADIEREAIAQIHALQARGLQLTHVDTHKHTHLFARVLRPLLRAATACGVTAIRNPYEPPWAQAATRGAPLTRRAQVRLLSLGRARFLRAVAAAGMRTPAGALGVLATGVLDVAVLRSILEALEQYGRPAETYELVCHPGFADAELARQRTRLQAERAREHAALAEVIPQLCSTANSPHTLVDFENL